MTTPAPLPIDISALLEPLPDPAHENLRAHVVSAVGAVWTNHLDLLGKLTAAQADLATAQQTVAAHATQITDQQAALDALTARVTALEPPPVPAPPPAL